MAPTTVLAAWPPTPPVGARSRFHRLRTAAVVVAIVIAGLFGITGCSSTPEPVNLASGKQIAAACPNGHQIAGRAAIDVSTHMRAIAADIGRLDPVRQLVRRVIICGGHLRVDAFSGSSADTAGVYDGDLQLPGSTENARLRREPAMTDQVMAQIAKNLPTAAAKLPLTGSDILAQFGMSAEYQDQLDPGGSHFALDLVITTDGVQSEGISLSDPALTVDQALVLAGHVRMPNLAGANVQVTSVGKTADPAPLTSYVDALKAFFGKVCTTTGAAHCTVVTDGAGR